MQRLAFVVASLIVLATPLAWRGIVHRWGPPAASLPPSYLPALEPARARAPFDPVPIEELKALQPGIVIIGDSMTLRIDAPTLRQLSGGQVERLVRLATGAAHWYLMFKNYVVASGVKPRWVVMFFRDAQLTDPMFRLTDVHRAGADPLALDDEDPLNRVVAAHVGNPWFRAHAFVDRLYAIEPTRNWLEPKLATWAGGRVVGTGARAAFVDDMNRRFGLDHLRPFAQADIADADAAALDFGARIQTSTLPLVLDLAREHGLRLCFVRVLRRPEGGRPPRESPALRQYVADLRQYLQQQGAAYLDDRSVPDLARLAYDDGDHILDSERVRYTELFYPRLAELDR